jgi:transposase InsO family protein
VSSLYYKAREREEADLVCAIEDIATRYPRYGSRRIVHQLAREPYFMRVNRKRVQSTFARARRGLS